MRRVLPIFLIVVLGSGLAAAADTPLTVDAIARLLAAGVDEDTLRDLVTVQESSFDLDARDILVLHEAGASSEFLRFLIRIDREIGDEAKGGRRGESGPGVSPAPPPPDGSAPAPATAAAAAAEAPALPASESGTAPVPVGPSQRVYSRVGQDGRTVIVFTNLDDDGNPLPADTEEVAFARITSRDEPDAAVEAGDAAVPAGIPVESGGPLVQVVVNPPPAPEPVQAPPPYPYVGAWPSYYTGYAGPTGFVDFPDQIPFLGYTIDNSYPKTFTGMGFPLFNDFGPKPPRKTPKSD